MNWVNSTGTVASLWSLQSVLMSLPLSLVPAPPRFTKVPVDQIGVSGGVVSFVCQATGDPKPRVSWNKKGKKVNSQRIEVRQCNLVTLHCPLLLWMQYGIIHINIIYIINTIQWTDLSKATDIFVYVAATGIEPTTLALLKLLQTEPHMSICSFDMDILLVHKLHHDRQWF